MNYQTSEAEIQVTQDILDFFNENPEMMNQAAQKTIQDALSGIRLSHKEERMIFHQERRCTLRLDALIV
jgi:hypothetical protein